MRTDRFQAKQKAQWRESESNFGWILHEWKVIDENRFRWAMRLFTCENRIAKIGWHVLKNRFAIVWQDDADAIFRLQTCRLNLKHKTFPTLEGSENFLAFLAVNTVNHSTGAQKLPNFVANLEMNSQNRNTSWQHVKTKCKQIRQNAVKIDKQEAWTKSAEWRKISQISSAKRFTRWLQRIPETLCVYFILSSHVRQCFFYYSRLRFFISRYEEFYRRCNSVFKKDRCES